MTRILIATSEPILARGFHDILLGAGFDAPEICPNLRELHERFLRCPHDLTILDYKLLNGPGIVADLLNAAPRCRLMVCARELPEVVIHELEGLGVRAIVPMSIAAGDLVECVNRLLLAPVPRGNPPDHLLRRCEESEKKIVSLIVQGMTDREIGKLLSYPNCFVTAAVRRLIRRFGLKQRGELALYGLAAQNRS